MQFDKSDQDCTHVKRVTKFTEFVIYMHTKIEVQQNKQGPKINLTPIHE